MILDTVTSQVVLRSSGSLSTRKVAPGRRLVLPGLTVRFIEGKPIVVLSGTSIRKSLAGSRRRELVDRLFQLPKLEILKLNGSAGEIRLSFKDLSIKPRQLLIYLAEALRGPFPSLSLPHAEELFGDERHRHFVIRRSFSGLSFWQVDLSSNHFFCLSHPLLREEYVRKKVLEELSILSGFVPKSIYLPFVESTSLWVFLPPHRFDPRLFQEVLDPVLTRCLAEKEVVTIPNLRDSLISANLSIAFVTDFLFPPLGIVNVVLIGLLSMAYVPRFVKTLRQGRVSLETLYLAISFLTVVTYQFFLAALMYWLMHFWPRRSRILVSTYRDRFLARYRLQPRRVWVDQGGATLETRLEDVQTSRILTLQAGDAVPGDGEVLDGHAQVDEQFLIGTGSFSGKGPGSPIYAASQVMEGSVRMKIHSLGQNTAAFRLGGWYERGLNKPFDPTPSCAFAEKTVAPVLTLSALAVFVGGLTMAKATLRPDYATGPMVSEIVDGLTATLWAAQHGILLADHSHLSRFSGSLSMIFDDSVAWQTPDRSQGMIARHLLKKGVAEVTFLSARSEKETASLAARLGFYSYYGGSSTETRLAYIAQRQRAGHTVIYVGDTLLEQRVARQADLAIGVLPPPFHGIDQVHMAFVSPDLHKILHLLAIARDSRQNLQAAVVINSVPNVIAVFAAFVLANPAISILLSNLGVLATYFRAEQRLHLSQFTAGRESYTGRSLVTVASKS